MKYIEGDRVLDLVSFNEVEVTSKTGEYEIGGTFVRDGNTYYTLSAAEIAPANVEGYGLVLDKAIKEIKRLRGLISSIQDEAKKTDLKIE